MLILGYTAEQIELQVLKIYFDQGHSRSPIEAADCWKNQNFTTDQRSSVSFIRANIILREGIKKLYEDFLNRDIAYAKVRREILKKNIMEGK